MCPNIDFSWSPLYLSTVWPVKCKWMCAGSSIWEKICSSDKMVDLDVVLPLPLYLPAPALNVNIARGVSVVLCDHEGKAKIIVGTV